MINDITQELTESTKLILEEFKIIDKKRIELNEKIAYSIFNAIQKLFKENSEIDYILQKTIINHDDLETNILYDFSIRNINNERIEEEDIDIFAGKLETLATYAYHPSYTESNILINRETTIEKYLKECF